MAHFAQIDESNTVIQVIVVDNNELLLNGVESEQKGIEFCQSLFGGNWVQTSYNGNFRKQFAGIGYKYDVVADVFILPKPYPSWSLDDNFDWQSPTPKPSQGSGKLKWDEQNLQWQLLEK